MTTWTSAAARAVWLSLLFVASEQHDAGAATRAQRCAAAKVKAVAAAGDAALRCFNESVKNSVPVDSACRKAVCTQLAADFLKAEKKGGCDTVDDAERTCARILDPFSVIVAAQLPGSIVPACSCGATPPTKLRLIGAPFAGNCGVVRDGGGASLVDLLCGFTYFGGGEGDVARSLSIPAGNETIFKVAACADRTLALGPTSAAEVGGANPDRRCTSAGCLFGNAPTPIPNLTTPGVSSCIVIKLGDDVAGTADCQGGSVKVDVPFVSDVYVGGDVLPARPGIQPCPICDPGPSTCLGGPNNGLPCIPFGPLVGNDATPVSHDCPPDPATFFGIALTFDFVFDTGTSIRTAKPSGTQQRVLCGFCRDISGAGQCFEGDPSGACPPSPTPGIAHRCRTDADCAEPFESCEQRTEGAFSFSTAQTITETGTPAGPIETGGPDKIASLVSTFCISPTFSAADPLADLPGPGASAFSQFIALLP